MPLTNNIIIHLNEITTSISSKKHLNPEDENVIKKAFKTILESGDLYTIDELESWFTLEGSWNDKPTIERIINIAHYQHAKHEASNKLKLVSDSYGCDKS